MNMEKRQCRLLTLDVWDTVIRRKCSPDEIKLKTAEEFLRRYGTACCKKLSAAKTAQLRLACEKRIGDSCRQNGYDDEYEIHDVFYMWCDRMLHGSKERTMQIAAQLYQFELENELKQAYLDPGILAFLDGIEYERLALVSDFYAGKDFVLPILEQCGFTKKLDAVYISCECFYNKRSGRLFDYVYEKEQMDLKQWIHIGDNGYSDVEVPKKKGITAVHYLPEKETKLRRYREKQFSWERAGQRQWKTSGHISEFFWGFILWLAQEAVSKGIRVLYFFTREGEFYKELYEEVKKHHPCGAYLPDAQVVEVSRLSTFMPSLREITLLEMMRIWNQYSVQSMEALFKSLGMDPAQVEDDLGRYGLSKEEVIQYPWQDGRVQQLFADENFVKKMKEERDWKRSLLYRYLAQKGWKQDSRETIGIVDIGWRGTIQDNLCYLYPSYQIHGFYIGLIPFLSPQPANSSKYGYLNDYQYYKMILSTVTPFEMLCNSPNGSTVAYRDGTHGVSAIRKKEACEDAVYDQVVKGRQQEIKRYLSIYAQKAEEAGLAPDDFKRYAFQAIYRFIAFPDRKMAEAYFNLKHNEEFGVGEFVNKTTRFRPGLFIGAIFSRKRRKQLMEFLRNTTWAQGYFVKYWMYPVLWIYNRLLLSYTNRK